MTILGGKLTELDHNRKNQGSKQSFDKEASNSLC